MTDPRYEEPVGGFGAEDLAGALQGSVRDVQARFQGHVGICVFVFDFGDAVGDAPHGFAYISNAVRADMLAALREFMAREAKQS